MDLTGRTWTWDEMKKMVPIVTGECVTEGTFIPAEPKYDTLTDDNGAEGVFKPSHYTGGSIETIEKIETVIEGLSGADAYLLGNVIKYVDRAGKKDGEDAEKDLAKANNYATRLCTGHWRSE